MKLIGLVCALALAGAVVVGCGDDEPVATGGSGGSGTGGAGGGTAGTGGGTAGTGGGTAGTGGGTAGTGGSSGDGACTGTADTAVFDSTTYTNEGGEEFSGDDAVAEIAGDCVFGATTLVSDGCGAEVGNVLGNNTPENQAALAACVVQCTVDQGVDLSAGCLSCYGDTVTCGAALCAGPCATGTGTPACVACRCGGNAASQNCFQEFWDCSGLPEGDDCD